MAIPRSLQGVGHKQPAGGVQGATLGAQVLGGLVGLCRCTITVPSEEGLGQRLHDHVERAGLSDAATSEPDGAVVVVDRGHRQTVGALVTPCLEPLLHGKGQESHSVNLLLCTAGLSEEPVRDGGWSLHCLRQGDPLRSSRQRSFAKHANVLAVVLA